MKLRLLLFTCLLTASQLFAQDKLSYAEKAAQLQKQIWGTEAPEFKATKIPENLTNESAVILARSYNSQRTTNGKVKFMIVTAAITTKTVKVNTLHERVKINDKSALENYSKLEYQKKLDRTISLGIVKFTNTQNTYLGVKIVKPDGKEVLVNTSEEVMLKNESKDQKGKLAISGLEVGDILDYYISSVEINEDTQNDSYKNNDDVFILVDEYPVLYYSIDFQFNKKVNVKYITANGAPDFQESRNDAGDILLSLKVRNLPKYQSQLWNSPLRQYPYVEVGSSFTNIYNMAHKRDSEINSRNSMLAGNKAVYQKAFAEFEDFDLAQKRLKEYFNGNKALKAAPLDSVMKVLYDQWKFITFSTYAGNELENISNMNYRKPNSKVACIALGMILTDMKIDHEVLMVASRNSNSLSNVFTTDDFEAMIRINTPTPMYMAFEDVFTHFNEIPANLQGEKAIAMRPERRNKMEYIFTERDAVLPVITADNNQIVEQLKVSLLPANMQKLKVDRLVKQTGALRHYAQKMLIPIEDVDNGYMALVNGEPLSKRLSRVKATKKMGDDYTYSFAKERQEMSKNFTAEIKGQFDQEPQQLTNFKIINPALDRSKPVFEFGASFVLDNLVKKAGNNYIVDAGKLTGTFLKLEEKDKTRDIDVYMLSARNFRYVISIAIPQGYSVKGVEELNQQKSNKTGSFSSVATVKDRELTITVNRVYNNNFEKAADWLSLKELIDTASSFNDQKILLEKEG